MAGKTDYGFNAEEAINSLRPDTPKRRAREDTVTEAPSRTETVSEEAKPTARPVAKKASQNAKVNEYMDWLKDKTDFNVRGGKSCNIRQRYHYRIAKMTELLGDKNLSISTYIDMVLGEHFRRFDEAMDIVMKQKFDEMQSMMSKEE